MDAAPDGRLPPGASPTRPPSVRLPDATGYEGPRSLACRATHDERGDDMDKVSAGQPTAKTPPPRKRIVARAALFAAAPRVSAPLRDALSADECAFVGRRN